MEAQTDIAAMPQRPSVEAGAEISRYPQDEAEAAFDLLGQVLARVEEVGRLDDGGEDDDLLERISALLSSQSPSAPTIEGVPS